MNSLKVKRARHRPWDGEMARGLPKRPVVKLANMTQWTCLECSNESLLDQCVDQLHNGVICGSTFP